MAGRLLERIRQGGEAAAGTEESVCAYLQELLNTPQGGQGTCPDFGLPAAVQVTRPEAVSERVLEPLIKQIEICVAKYEPRLRQFEFAGHEADRKSRRFKARLVRHFHDDGRPKETASVQFLVELGELGRIRVTLVG